MTRLKVVCLAILLAVACQKQDKDAKQRNSALSAIKPAPGVGAGSAVLAKPLQVTPPLDVKQPPPDAVKSASGLAVKKLVTVEGGKSPGRNDVVTVKITGWRSGGETFRTSKEAEPMPLSSAAPGFVEGIGMMKKGEKAMMWIPGAIGYRTKPAGVAEDLVYEVELVDVMAAPDVPADVAAPPATAQATKSGIKYIVVKPPVEQTRARSFDNVAFHYTGWDSTGRMIDSSEVRKKPATMAPLKQSPIMQEMLETAQAGSRVRFWAPADKLTASGKPLMNVTGTVCYELEILHVAKATATPPPAPPMQAPADALKSPKGVAYKIVKPGKGEKTKPTDVLRTKWTGWTAKDGRMFETWVTTGEMQDVTLTGTTVGFSDLLPLLTIGDTVRAWIPEELAYKNAPGKPQGPLVVEMEVVEVRKPVDAHGHGHDDPHAGTSAAKGPQPAPPDVAAPPKDAKKTPAGVFYKVLTAGAGGPKPTTSSRVRVHYSGWKTDGENFDSSYKNGKPAEFALTGVIKGWTDGLQLMSVGDKYRFWIPEELAYKDMPSRPQGMLVFDVELLEIK